ncbi:hypothetical protein G2W53_023343 [Senna tora]|uniref:Uncharacterized protein n=1 Tax=Senna tora TaxID=362788 RepID=A0A834T9F1_9FABA|nr:hypothetical protein G2W53_023343 [Senna tora]
MWLQMDRKTEPENSKAEEADSHSTETPKLRDSWPFRIKLSSDNIRWDSLKISPSKEFEESILGHMNAGSRKALEAWIPVSILIYDADTCETYNAKMAKKESFWFNPMPCFGEKRAEMREPPCYDLEKAREEFAYSIEPFRHIVKRRDLKRDQEIGLRISGNKTMVEGLEFSVLHSPLLGGIY